MSEHLVLAMPKLPAQAIALLRQEFDVHHLAPDEAKDLPPGLSGRVTAIATPGRDPGLGGQLGPGLLDQLPRLAIISSFSSGLDGIDVEAAFARGIVIGHAPDVLAEPVADIALGLAIDIMRGITAGDRYVRAGRWAGEGGMPLATSLGGRRAGILGLGRIGKALARRLAACGMQVAYTGRARQADIPYAFVPTLSQLATESDILFCSCPATPETESIIDAGILSALGPNGFLVNIARGSVVDEDALIAALREGRLKAAGIDVCRNEPHADPRLLDVPNLVVLPHLGGSTEETRLGMFEAMAENLRLHFAGKPVAYPYRPY